MVPANPQTDNKPTTIKIDKVTVEAADFDRLGASNKDELPRFLKMRLEGVTGDGAASRSLATYGVPETPADLALDYKLDTAAKRLTLDKLEISLRGQGRIELSFVLEGVSDKAAEMEDARDNGRLQRASLTIDDKAFLPRSSRRAPRARATSRTISSPLAC